MKFPGGATRLDSFLKVYKTSATRSHFPYEWFDDAEKLQKMELLPYDNFFSKLRSCNPLEAEYKKYVNLLRNGRTTDQAVTKLNLTKPPPTEIKNYEYLQKVWQREQLSTFRKVLQW